MSTRRSSHARILRRAVSEILEARQLLSASYTITDLGTLPGGTSSVAIAVNAGGETVGYSDTDGTGNHEHAFLWTAAGGMQDLGTLAGDVLSHAEAINSAGDVVGYSQDSQGVDNAFLWTPTGGMVDIGTLISGGSSAAYGINDSNVVVGEALVAGAVNHAFIWSQANGMADLGTLGSDGGETSFATAINNNNDVVGSAEDDSGDEHAFVWTQQDGMADIGTLFNDADSVAYGINDSGQITGSSGDDVTTAFLWTPGGTDGLSSNPQMAALGDLGGDLSEGDSINASGQVCGYSQDGVTEYADATLWDVNAFDATDLNYQIPDDANWGLDDAYSINDNGMIVGSGEAPNGDEHAFLLAPVGLLGPGAVTFAPDLTEAGASEVVNVFYYSDTSSIDQSTIDASNLSVTGPDGSSLAVSLTNTIGGDGFVEADYTIAAPNGSWNAADTGTYTVSVIPGIVKDTNGGGVTADSTTFDVNLTIDSTWAPQTGGSVTIPFTVEQLVPEASGSVLSVGLRTTNGVSQGVLESFTASNVLDPTFATGSKGVVATPSGANDAFYSAAIQTDGKIVAVGGSNGEFLIARYNADGSPDTTFGAGGFATADFGADDPATASSIVIQPDGSIVVGGVANGIMAVARFTSGGALDSTFNPGGAADPAFPAGGQRTIATGAASTVGQILLQGDGKILGVGNSGSTASVFRLNADGTDDDSFGASGIAPISQLAAKSADNSADVESLAIQPGGAILVSGQANGGGLGVARLTPGGQLDASFAGGGFVDASFGGSNDRADSVLVNQTDGSFILVGTTDAGGASQTAVAAFNPDGSTNTAFGLNGRTTFASATGRATTTTSNTRAFHAQLTDFAFGALQSNGGVLIDNTNQATASVRRIQPFSSSAVPVGTSFGKIGRKNVKLPPFTLDNGATVIITLTGGGSGTAIESASQVNLTITGPAAITVKTHGGANTLNLSSVMVNGKLVSFSAPTATLSGMFLVSGNAGTVTLGAVTGVFRAAGSITSIAVGSVSGSISCGGILKTAKFGVVTGTIAAALAVSNFTAGNLSGATVLAGVDLASDGQLGGVAAAADIYGAGQIMNMRITGTITGSFIGAGVNPTDGVFGNGNDSIAGAGGAIRSLTVKGSVDQSTHFEAAAFPKLVHLPAKIVPAADARFIVL